MLNYFDNNALKNSKGFKSELNISLFVDLLASIYLLLYKTSHQNVEVNRTEPFPSVSAGNTKGDDLLFDWFGISCMTTDNFSFYLQNRLIPTSQTGGQWYSDTSPFSIPWLVFPEAIFLIVCDASMNEL